MNEAEGAEPALELRGIVRTYHQAGTALEVLRGASLSLRAGETTLLHIAGLLERPDGGEVFVAGRECGSMSDGERTAIRRKNLGFVYQFHHLLPEFSALENVMLPQMIAGVARGEAKERARHLLD